MSVSKEFRPVRLIKQLPRVRTLGVGVPFQNSFSIIVNALEFVSIVFAPKSTAPPLIRRFRGFCRRRRRRPRVVLASSSRQEDQRRDAAPSPLPRVQLDDKEPFVPTRRLLLYHRKTKRLRHRATRTQRLFSLSLSSISSSSSPPPPRKRRRRRRRRRRYQKCGNPTINFFSGKSLQKITTPHKKCPSSVAITARTRRKTGVAASSDAGTTSGWCPPRRFAIACTFDPS